MTMKPVESLDQYKALVKETKAQHPGTLTNSIQLAASMAPYIDEKRLFFAEWPQGIAFFLDERTWYEVTFFWDPAEAPADFRQEKPVIASTYPRGGEPGAVGAFLEQAGFRKYRTNMQIEMALTPDKDVTEAVGDKIRQAEEQGFTFRYCEDDALMERVLELWDTNLELGDIPVDHRRRHPSDKTLCVFHGEKLAAVNWWRNTKGSSEVRHTVTHPDYYHRGLASAMLIFWCRDAARSGCKKAIGWIDDTNIRSFGLYGKAGFTVNGRCSVQYVLGE